MSSESPSSAKVVMLRAVSLGRYALGSRTSLPVVRRRLQVLVRPARLREPVDGSLDDPQLAATRRARTGRAAARRPSPAGAARQCISQKPTTALRAAHQRAGGDRVGLARRDPVGDEPPERRERASATRRTRGRRPSPARRRRARPPLASISASVEVLARDVDRGVGAQLERQLRASPRSTRWRSRGRRRTAGRAGPRASRRRRPPRARPRSRPRPAARTSCTGATRSGPGSAARAPASSETPSGIGNVAAVGTTAYSA